jgi:hypothetical protein
MGERQVRTSRRARAAAGLLLIATMVGAAGAGAVDAEEALRPSAKPNRAPTLVFTKPGPTDPLSDGSGNPVTVIGKARDDRGVKKVLVRIEKDYPNSRWWNGTAWQKKQVSLKAKLSSPGAKSTKFTMKFRLPDYPTITFYAEAFDKQGESSGPRFVPIDVQTPSDLVMNEYTIPDTEPGEQTATTMEVANLGRRAYNRSITVTTTVSAGASFPSLQMVGTGWTCSRTSSVVTCTTAAGIGGASSSIAGIPNIDVGSNPPENITVTHSITAGKQPTANDTLVQSFTTTPA